MIVIFPMIHIRHKLTNEYYTNAASSIQLCD